MQVYTPSSRSVVKLTIFAFLLIAHTCLNAQWVPINPSFSAYISTYISNTAVSGNMLDTTNAAVINLQNLTINDTLITDITGIQYFDALENLVVNCRNLSNTPLMPAGLITLRLSTAGSSLASPLPVNLTALKIFGGALTTIPLLPASVTNLILSNLPYFNSLSPFPNNITSITLSNLPLLNVFPIFPASVLTLDVSETQYNFSPNLPVNLETFSCNYCTNIVTIPALPYSLKSLYATHCSLTTFGTTLQAMDNIDLSYNPITDITDLPDTVEYLDLSNLPSLYALPLQYIYVIDIYFYNDFYADVESVLPYINAANGSAANIGLRNCNIYDISGLSTRILSLDASNNPITVLPAMPYIPNYGNPFRYCEWINLSHCSIDSIDPNFFDGSPMYLSYFDASFNHLTSINNLPISSTDYLDLSYNQINNYPYSLSTTTVYLNNNQIPCLPYINMRVHNLNISNNPINCLPNIPDSAFHCTPALTVCLPGNSNNCTAFSEVEARVFNDINQNGSINAGEAFLPNYNVFLMPYGGIKKTDSSGLVSFNPEINTNCSITALPTYPYRITTTIPYNFNLNAYGISDTGHYFGVHTTPNVNDLIVRITPYVEARPGFNHKYKIMVRNEGTTVQNSNVTFYFDSALIYQSSTAGGIVSANSITWPITNLQPLQSLNFEALFIVPAVIPLGSHVNAGAFALGNVPDTTIADNHDTLSQIAVGSYDPNDKHVSPADGLSKQEILAGKYLEYLVRFQNTGTASAINIRVEDTLSTNLDLSTFEMLDASHDYDWQISNGLLTIYFNNIQLPDSGTNEIQSHGFFRFRIKPYSTASINDQINNTAYIYFDFNPAIITNTASTSVTTLFIKQPESQQLCTGERMLLTVKTSSNVFSKQWYKNGLALGISSDTIYVDSATSAYNGQYMCKATLANGEVYNSITIGVHVFDYIQALPTLKIINSSLRNDTLYVCGTTNNINTTYAFSAVATNAGNTPEYKWYINDTLIYDTDASYPDIRHVFHTGDILSCFLNTPCLSRMAGDSVFIIVINQVDTMHVSITPNLPHICPGQEVLFTANTVNVVSPSNISWYKNQQLLGRGITQNISNLAATDKIICMAPVLYNSVCPIVFSANGYQYNYDTTQIIIDSSVIPPTPNLNISTLTYPFCAAGTNSFRIENIMLGTSPHFQWLLNGVAVGTDTAYLAGNYFNENDMLQCSIARNMCSADTFISNPLTLFTDTPLTQSVHIYVVDSGSCGSWINVYSNTTGLGSAITYAWFVNGAMSGHNTLNTFIRGNNGTADTISLTINTHNSCTDSLIYSNILILPSIPKRDINPTLNISGPLNVCKGQTLALWDNISSQNHHWYRNGILKGTSQTGSFSYSPFFVSDTIDFIVYDIISESSCYRADTSDTLTVHVFDYPNLVPQIELSMTPQSVCNNQLVTFSANTNFFDLNSQITWRKNGSPFGTGNTISTIYLQDGDVIICKALAQRTCYNYFGYVSDSIVIHTFQQTPAVEIVPQVPIGCTIAIANTFSVSGYYLGSYPQYEWIKNGTIVGNTYQYAANNLQPNDMIYCRVTSNNPCITNNNIVSDTVHIINGVPMPPSITITATQPAFCQGANANFTSSISLAGNAPTYQWQVNGNNTTSTGNTYTSNLLNNNDTVVCILVSSDVCASPPQVISNQLIVTIDTLVTPSVSIVALPSLNICQGEAISFTAMAEHGGSSPMYTWVRNGLSIQTGQSYTTSGLNNGDQVFVKLTSNEICISQATVTSTPELITVHIPSIPVITQANNLLSSSSDAGNQWLYNGSEILGATLPTYVITQQGWYALSVTDTFGCTAISDSIFATPLSVGNIIGNDQIQIWPNPASDFILVKSTHNWKDADVTITDLTGRIVLTSTIKNNTDLIETEKFAKGVYFIKLGLGDIVYTHKLILQ